MALQMDQCSSVARAAEEGMSRRRPAERNGDAKAASLVQAQAE